MPAVTLHRIELREVSFNVLTVKYLSSQSLFAKNTSCQTSCTLALSFSGLSSTDGSVELREGEREGGGGTEREGGREREGEGGREGGREGEG